MTAVAPRSITAELTPLTGLRGFAAFWVLLYHVWVESTPRAMMLGPLDLTPLFSAGSTGVDIFFTLSAFLLSLPYASRQLEGAPRPSLRTFWLRRVQRILPAYYAQLLVLVALAAAFGIGAVPGLRQFVGNLLLLNDLGPYGVAPINPVAYTLPIEFGFYLLLPLLAFGLAPRRWPWLALFAIVVTQLWRHGMFPHIAQADVSLRVIALEQMPGRLDQFVAGMLGAYAYTRAAARNDTDPRVLELWLLSGIALFAALLWMLHYRIGTYWDGHPLLFVWHGLVGVATAMILYASALGSRIARVLFDNAPLRWLGLVSFGLYLWHFPVLRWLAAAHVFDGVPGYHLPWLLPAVLLPACAIAWASYRWVELPFLRMGRAGRRPQLATEMIVAEGDAAVDAPEGVR